MYNENTDSYKIYKNYRTRTVKSVTNSYLPESLDLRKCFLIIEELYLTSNSFDNKNYYIQNSNNNKCYSQCEKHPQI